MYIAHLWLPLIMLYSEFTFTLSYRNMRLWYLYEFKGCIQQSSNLVGLLLIIITNGIDIREYRAYYFFFLLRKRILTHYSLRTQII